VLGLVLEVLETVAEAMSNAKSTGCAAAPRLPPGKIF
jgi:hypothetical protein